MSSAAYKALLDEAWDLHQRKNAGYAGEDNADPWANFRMSEAFGISAFDGCLVRLSDKYIRITNLRKRPENDKVNESIRDTLQDLAAYALIAVCLLDEEKAEPYDPFTDPDKRAAFEQLAWAREQLGLGSWRDTVVIRTDCGCPQNGWYAGCGVHDPELREASEHPAKCGHGVSIGAVCDACTRAFATARSMKLGVE